MKIELFNNTCENKKMPIESRMTRILFYQQYSRIWLIGGDDIPEKMLQWFGSAVKKMSRETKGHRDLCIFDIGCAEGCYVNEAMKNAHNAHIICFEPEEPRKAVLVENLATMINRESYHNEGIPPNFNIEVHQKIVSDGKNPTVRLRHYECAYTGEGAGSSTVIKTDRPSRRTLDIEYDAVCLDDFINKLQHVDIVKIDVEGSECQVLEGAIEFIKKFRPVIFLEIHTEERFGSVSLDDVKKVIDKTGDKDFYKYQLIEEHPELQYYMLTPTQKKGF